MIRKIAFVEVRPESPAAPFDAGPALDPARDDRQAAGDARSRCSRSPSPARPGSGPTSARQGSIRSTALAVASDSTPSIRVSVTRMINAGLISKRSANRPDEMREIPFVLEQIGNLNQLVLAFEPHQPGQQGTDHHRDQLRGDDLGPTRLDRPEREDQGQAEDRQPEHLGVDERKLRRGSKRNSKNSWAWKVVRRVLDAQEERQCLTMIRRPIEASMASTTVDGEHRAVFRRLEQAEDDLDAADHADHGEQERIADLIRFLASPWASTVIPIRIAGANPAAGPLIVT